MPLVTSQTYDFSPSGGSLVMSAFSRCQVRRTEIEQPHMLDGIQELNFLLSRMSNMQPNLWTIDLQAAPLTQGIATYSVAAETVNILDAYIRFTNSPDRIVWPISRTEYASYPNKTQQGVPSVFWYDRLVSPTFTLWLVPDGNGPYTLFYYRTRQIQDANYANGQNVEVPYLWLDALVAGLAHRLARIYAPQLVQVLKMDSDEAWAIAAKQNVEDVPLYISPGLSSYWR